MLYLVHSHRAKTRAKLLEEASRALDFDQYPVLRAFGLGNQGQNKEMIFQGLDELFERGWLDEKESLQVTRAGKVHLQSQARKVRRMMGRSFIAEKP